MATLASALQTVFVERRLPWRVERWLTDQPYFIRWQARQRQARETRLFRRFVRAGDLVFDIGANIGDKTAIFRQHGARVICVEPDDRNVAALRARFADDQDVHLIPHGAGATHGSAQFYHADAHERSSFAPDAIGDDVTYAEAVTVPITTLDELIDRFGRPNFIKIDVEGYEPAVLRGLSQSVSALCFEFHRGLELQLTACLDRLEQIRMQWFNVLLYPVGGVKRYHPLDRLYFQRPVNRQRLADTLQQWPGRPLAGDVYAFR